MTTAIPAGDITAVILAGGKARRMGGEDKGLIELGGRRLIEYIIAALQPQTDNIIINANRNHDAYGEYGLPVVADIKLTVKAMVSRSARSVLSLKIQAVLLSWQAATIAQPFIRRAKRMS